MLQNPIKTWFVMQNNECIIHEQVLLWKMKNRVSNVGGSELTVCDCDSFLV